MSRITATTSKPLIGLRRNAIEQLLVGMGERPFRGRQIAHWLYRKGARDFEGMTNLPQSLRGKLNARHHITNLTPVGHRRSRDGCIKIAFRLHDNEVIETVYLPYAERTSVCISSQVGCPIRCRFCATGQSGFVRNLTAGEIVEQVLYCQSIGRVTHVVFMGMGEPLLNYEAVITAIHLLNEEIGIGMRNVTLSTIGIPARIRKLASEKLQLTLAVSLHAPHDRLQDELIPGNPRGSIHDVVDVCREYVDVTGRRVTFEYVLLDGVNDHQHHARQLCTLLKNLRCKVNLVPYNSVATISEFRHPRRERIAAFRRELELAGIAVTQRQERGQDIEAACGQLRGQLKATDLSHNSYDPKETVVTPGKIG